MKRVKLGDMCAKIGSGATPRGGSDVYLPKGQIALIRSQNVYNDGFKKEGLVYITDTHAKELDNVIVGPDDVLLNITGDSVARCCQVPTDVLAARVNQHVAIIRPRKEKLDPRYLRYYLIEPTIQNHLLMLAGGGATRKALTKGMIETLVVNLPPLSEQRAIAAVLGALDDKIELNRRMNRTLESIAQAVFREMMKDEGGRMNGRETTIGEVVTVVGGTTPSTTNSAFWGGDICWATPKDLASLQSPILLDTNSRITELGLQEISSGILPAGTVLLSSRAPIGYVAITHIPVAINQGFIAIKCTDEVPNYFILNWLKDNMEEIIGRANGTTFLEISKSNFRTIPIFIPPVEKMKNFVEIVEPIYQKIVANLKQSRTLAALRDALLPKLMRAEVRVAVHE